MTINTWIQHTITLTDADADIAEKLFVAPNPEHRRGEVLLERTAVFGDGRTMLVRAIAGDNPAEELPWSEAVLFDANGRVLGATETGETVLRDFIINVGFLQTQYTVTVKRADPKPHNEDENGNYLYGIVESPRYIAQHIEYDLRYCRTGMRFGRSEDRAFAYAALDYFHPESPQSGSEEALKRMIDQIPDQGEWRQGASSHNLAIWPEGYDSPERMSDVCLHCGVTQVGDFRHGELTWFCIMAYAFAVDARRRG